VVSVRLIAEVLDHYHGNRVHKLWLLAFAEVANDHTRSGWCKRELLASRVGVSETRFASALIAEGVIKRERGGNRYHTSVYVLGELNGKVQPERPRTNDDGGYPW
jgi:hypothetical protein